MSDTHTYGEVAASLEHALWLNHEYNKLHLEYYREGFSLYDITVKALKSYKNKEASL